MAKDKETLIVGDIHGQIDALENAIAYADDNDMNIIFLGDLPDSFKRSQREQIECMKLVYQRMEKGDYCVWGNHDLSYLWPHKHNCSGWSYNKAKKFKPFMEEIQKHNNFVAFYYFEDFKILITHAGLTDHLVPKTFKNHPIDYLKSEVKTDDFINSSKLLEAGSSSGGRALYGGITWMRPSDYKPLRKDIFQIAGHTAQHGGILKLDNLWIIDVLEYGNQSLVKVTTEGDVKEITKQQYWS